METKLCLFCLKTVSLLWSYPSVETRQTWTCFELKVLIFETNHIQKSQQVPHFFCLFFFFLYEIKADILPFKFLSVILAVLSNGK